VPGKVYEFMEVHCWLLNRQANCRHDCGMPTSIFSTSHSHLTKSFDVGGKVGLHSLAFYRIQVSRHVQG